MVKPGAKDLNRLPPRYTRLGFRNSIRFLFKSPANWRRNGKRQRADLHAISRLILRFRPRGSSCWQFSDSKLRQQQRAALLSIGSDFNMAGIISRPHLPVH